MKITQEVRDFAAAEGLKESEAVEEGLRRKAEEFRDSGGEVYRPSLPARRT
jgi:phosphomethylpyrimidine synthase